MKKSLCRYTLIFSALIVVLFSAVALRWPKNALTAMQEVLAGAAT